MDKVFYNSKMTNISIIKSSSDLDNKVLFPVSCSYYLNIWISSDNDNKEEDNIDTDDLESSDSDMSESLSSLVHSLWKKIQIHINTDFSVTRWMLCEITRIRKDTKYQSDSDHSTQVKKLIKTSFYGISKLKTTVTQEIFCTEYNGFDNKNGSFDGGEFIWKSKYISDGNINLWHQKY